MDFSTLNPEQYQATTFEGKHLLVLAGAGTGKTRTIIARAVYLLQQGVRPGSIKILSFTRKSANEIVSRIQIESENLPCAQDLSGSTFHSWGMELIQRYPQIFRLTGYTCMDDEDQLSAIKLCMGRVYNKQKITVKDLRITAKQILEVYSYSVNTRKNLTDSIKFKFNLTTETQDTIQVASKIKSICEPVIRVYLDYKNSRKYIDYDDMLNIVAMTFRKTPDFREIVASQYTHILVDEAQDTNPLQWILLENFFPYCHLFCVGDDAQSIYSFRGADFKSIHSFSKRVPEGQIIKLNRNYRSYQEILNLANWVLKCSPLDYDKDLVSERGSGEKPIIYYLDGEWEEAELITDMIAKAFAEEQTYGDHMVLGRSIMHLRKVEAACLKKHIPYVVYGGTGLMKSAHVRDVVSALRIIANYKDELAWIRYLLLWNGIGDVTASKIVDVALEQNGIYSSINSILPRLPSGQDPYDTLFELIDLSLNPKEAIDIALMHLEPRLQLHYDNWDFRKKDFTALKMVAAQCKDIATFINEFVLDPSVDAIKGSAHSPSDVVRLSTIHSAKGLESKCCYIVNVSPKTFPSSQAVSDDEIEEERRCLYVALTRAKDKLYIFSRRVLFGMSDLCPRYKHNSDESLSGILLSQREKILFGDDELPIQTIECQLKTDSGDILSMNQDEFERTYTIVNREDELKKKYFLNNLPDELVEVCSLEEKNARIPSRYNNALLNDDPFIIGEDFDFS